MSFSSWVDTRVAAAIETAVPLLAAQEGPLVQALATAVTKAVIDAVVGAVAAQIGTLGLNIPHATAALLTNELNQLPQQINTLLNVPAEVATAVETAVANLPAEVANAIKGILPFPL